MFFQGFKMGFLVGGIFGGLMGTYYAITYRQFMYIPMSAIGSGASFGFFMGLGMIMRTEMEGKEQEEGSYLRQQQQSEYMITRIDPETGKVSYDPMYKRHMII